MQADGTITSGSSITIDGSAGAERIVSTDALELHTSSGRVLRVEPGGNSVGSPTYSGPVIIGGWEGNTVTPGVIAATICGGGADESGGLVEPNRVTDDWGTIGGGGNAETGHNEVGQERMDVPWWVELDAYIKSSPVHGIQDMNKPMLMCFGGSDTNVNPLLGYEFYNAARRLGKQMVLLVYPGENHSNRQKPNQIDYHHRILEWYATYLKGEPAPKWITDGIRFDDIEAERERARLKAEELRAKEEVGTSSASSGRGSSGNGGSKKSK